MTAHGAARLAVLRNRDFSLYLVARLLGTLAVQMQTVAVGWQVYEVTRDPLDLGLIGLSQFLPFIAVDPAGRASRGQPRPAPHRHGLLRARVPLRAAAARVRAARHDRSRAGVRRHDAVRRCARIRDAGRPGAAAEPRAARAVRRGGRDQLFAPGRSRRSPGRRWAASSTWPERRSSTRASAGLFAVAIAMTLAAARGRIAGTAARVGDARDPALGSASSYAAAAWCSARFRSTCSPCCSAARPRCCRCMRPTCCTSVRTDSAGCARRRRSAPRPAASCLSLLPITRQRRTPHVRRRRRVRRCDDRVRPLDELLAVDGRADRCSARATW